MVAVALETGAIPDKFSAILVDFFGTVCKDGAALPSDNHSGWGIHSFLAQIELGVELFPGLERVTLFGVNPDGMVYILHSLFSVRFDL